MFILICWLLFYYFHSCFFLFIWLVIIDGESDEMSYSKEAQLKFQTRGSQAQAQILPLQTQAHNPFII